MERVEREPKEDRWETLKDQLEEYEKEASSVAVFDIYEKAKTPHESMRSLSASIGGLPVGVKNVKELVQEVEKFTRSSAESTKGDTADAEKAISVLDSVREQARAEKPDAQEVDKKLAEFTRDRIEKFFSELDVRAQAAGIELDEETRKNFSVPLDIMRSFYQGPDAFFRYYGIKPNEEQQKLHNFLREYPAVFLHNTLESVYSKRPDSKYPVAFDPMTPLDVVKEHRKEVGEEK